MSAGRERRMRRSSGRRRCSWCGRAGVADPGGEGPGDPPRDAAGMGQADRRGRRARDGLTSEERAEIARLRREVRILKEEREVLKKPRLLRAGERDPVRCFRFVAAEEAQHPVALLCRVLDVSRAGYYAWRRRSPSARARADGEPDAGDPRHSCDQPGHLRQPAGARRVGGPRVQCGRKRVARLMRRRARRVSSPPSKAPHDAGGPARSGGS